jgi:hypothetical protein
MQERKQSKEKTQGIPRENPRPNLTNPANIIKKEESQKSHYGNNRYGGK